jgi:hypothetical protein
MTNAQLSGLTTAQIASLSTEAIEALSTAQMAAFGTAALQAFTTDQIAALETQDLAALTMTQSTAFTGAQISVMSAEQIDSLLATSPIVLDLDGNGVSTLAASAGVNFDINATGNAHRVGWASATDGLLVRDRNGDGIINDGSELYGSATRLADGSRASNGYAALAMEDSNHDGVLNQADAAFKDLRLWVDANSNGVTDAGELHTLAEFGITSLNLNHTVTDTVDHGNLLALSSSYTTTDGKSHDMADVWFARDTGTAAASSGTTPDLTAHDLLAAPGESALVTAANAATSTASSTAGASTSSADASSSASSTAATTTHAADTSGAADQVMVDTAAIAAVQGLADAMLEEQHRQVLI